MLLSIFHYSFAYQVIPVSNDSIPAILIFLRLPRFGSIGSPQFPSSVTVSYFLLPPTCVSSRYDEQIPPSPRTPSFSRKAPTFDSVPPSLFSLYSFTPLTSRLGPFGFSSIRFIEMVDPSSSSPPFSPPLPSPPHPPPPSPILHGPTPVRRRSSKRAVFEIASASPQSFTSEEQTTLKERLELSRRRKITVKPGVPARLLSQREMEESSSSGVERDQKETGRARNDEVDKARPGRGSDSSSSPWVTDSETPSQQVVSDILAERRKKSSGGQQYAKRGGAGKPRCGAIRIEGFDIPADQQSSTPLTSPSTPRTPRRPALCSTSSLSRLFAHATPSIETTPLEPSEPPPSDLPLPQPVTVNPGATWNTDIFGAALAAENRSTIPSASTEASTVDHRSRSRSTTVSSSSTLPRTKTSLSTSSSRSTLAAASKRPHFLSPSPSIVSTPSHSPPRSLVIPTDEKDLNLQFIRRPGFTRQGSAGENLSRMCSGRGEKDMKISGSSALTTEGNSETVATDTEVEHSESEESELSSIFRKFCFFLAGIFEGR